MWTVSNQAVLFQFQIKRAPGYAQQPCGCFPVITCGFQRLLYRLLFRPLHIQSVIVRGGDIHRKANLLESDPAPLRQHTCTSHHIFQLADIAGPRIGHESFPYVPVKSPYFLFQFLIRKREEESGKRYDILPTIY